jgi:hypothetical protein
MQMPACLYGLTNASRTFGGTSCAVSYALMTVRIPVGKLTSNAAYDNAVALWKLSITASSFSSIPRVSSDGLESY